MFTKRVLRLFAAAILASAMAPGQEVRPPKDARIWALDDTDKVSPVTGNLLSEGLDVYRGERPGKGAYRISNSVWDAATNTVKLFAGRNEFVSFQVVIEAGRQDLHKVFVNATDLIGAKERISADSHIRLFKELYNPVNGVWYPDALLPFELGGVTPLDVPERAPSAPGQRVQPVWIDIYVPHNLPPDTYTGQIIVLQRNTDKQAILNVQLEVGTFTLPDKLGLDIDLMNYGFLNIERGFPDAMLDSPQFRKIEREFFRMAHAHRTTFAIVPYNHDGSIPKGLKPELAGANGSIRIPDWKPWDDRFGPLLSGEAFKDLPRAGQPLDHFFLPYNLMWPSDMRNWQKPAYTTEHLRVSEAIRKHFAEKGWTRTLYQIYYNHKESYGFFPWNLDEPTRQTDLDALSYLGGILKESFPKNDPVKVVYRLDIGHFHCENDPACKYPRESGKKAVDALSPFVGLWNINSEHYYPNLPEVRKLKQMGKTVYFYSGTPRISEPLIDSVYWGWRGYKYEADGICFWDATDWGDWNTDAPPADPYTNGGGHYAGFSMIFYPGSKFGYDGPIAALRLKTLRRGLQDFEYLKLIEASGRKSRADLIALGDKMLLDKDGRDYQKLRRILFDSLSGK